MSKSPRPENASAASEERRKDDMKRTDTYVGMSGEITSRTMEDGDEVKYHTCLEC